MTIFKILIKLEYSTKHVAQWIEHQIPILKAGGSIPFMLNCLGAVLVSTFKKNESMIQVEVCNLRKKLQN